MPDSARSATSRPGTGIAWFAGRAAASAAALAANLAVPRRRPGGLCLVVVVDNGDRHGVDARRRDLLVGGPLVVGVALTALVALRGSASAPGPGRRGRVRLRISVAGPLTSDTRRRTAAALALMHVIVVVGVRRRTGVARRSLARSQRNRPRKPPLVATSGAAAAPMIASADPPASSSDRCNEGRGPQLCCRTPLRSPLLICCPDPAAASTEATAGGGSLRPVLGLHLPLGATAQTAVRPDELGTRRGVGVQRGVEPVGGDADDLPLDGGIAEHGEVADVAVGAEDRRHPAGHPGVVVLRVGVRDVRRAAVQPGHRRMQPGEGFLADAPDATAAEDAAVPQDRRVDPGSRLRRWPEAAALLAIA